MHTCCIGDLLFVGEFFVGDLERCLEAFGLRSFVGELDLGPWFSVFFFNLQIRYKIYEFIPESETIEGFSELTV